MLSPIGTEIAGVESLKMQTIGGSERNRVYDGLGTKTRSEKYPAPIRTALILGTCVLSWSATIATVQYLWW